MGRPEELDLVLRNDDDEDDYQRQMELFEEYLTTMPPGREALDTAGDRPSARQIGGDHYKTMRIQPTTFIEQNKLGWCEGNAVKYICRHNTKHGEKDILKAIHYLELLLEKEYAYVRTKDTMSGHRDSTE